jgi:hypothetical protein
LYGTIKGDKFKHIDSSHGTAIASNQKCGHEMKRESQGYIVCSSRCPGMDFQTPVTQAKELTHENLAVPNPGAPD